MLLTLGKIQDLSAPKTVWLYTFAETPRTVEAYELFGMGAPKRIRPAAGTLLIFPGWLEHHVEVHTEATPRISFSFNIMAKVVQ